MPSSLINLIEKLLSKEEPHMGFMDRIQRGWNAFRNRDPTQDFRDTGMIYYYRPDRPRFTRRNERTIMTSVLNRIALDASAIDIMHVRLDENGRFLEIMDSGLNNCLTLSANAEQT